MSNKKKIIFLGKLPPPYIGPALAAERILKSNLTLEFELIHLDTSDHRGIDKFAAFNFHNILLAIKQYIQLLWLIIKHRPDIIYIPSQQTTIGYLRDLIYIVISKIFNKKVICHLRGGHFKEWYDNSNSLMKFIVRKTQTIIDAQIVLGNNLISLFDWCMPKEKVFVVPNGGNYPELVRLKKNLNDKIEILFLANFNTTKGILDVLEAAKFLETYSSKIRFSFIGALTTDKLVTSKMNSIVEKLNDLEIRILGPKVGVEKFQFLKQTDIFVFPTYYKYEGHPWVIVEALAAGIPIISTNIGAIVESVQDGINGFIVPIKSPIKLAEKLEILINDEKLRRSMGIASHNLYQNKFTEEIMINNLAQCFKTILNKS